MKHFLNTQDWTRPELDALLASVIEIGERANVPRPNLDALMGLTRLAARSRGLTFSTVASKSCGYRLIHVHIQNAETAPDLSKIGTTISDFEADAQAI